MDHDKICTERDCTEKAHEGFKRCPECYKRHHGEYPPDYMGEVHPADDYPEWAELAKPMQMVRASKNKPLIDRYFNEGEVSILASPPKSGKTWLCLDIAIKAAMGSPVFGRHRPTKGPLQVLYLFGDNQPGFLKERADKLGELHEECLNLRVLDQYTFRTGRKKLLDLVDPNDFDKLVEVVKHWKIDLIFIDTLVAWTGINEAKNEELRPLLLNLQRLAHDTNAHVCVLHHNRKESGHGSKMDKIIGGTVLVRLVGEIYSLKADVCSDSGEIKSSGWFLPLGGWYEKPSRFYYHIQRIDDETTTIDYDFDKVITSHGQDRIIEEIKLMTEPWTIDQMAKITGEKYQSVYRVVKKLEDNDEIERKTHGWNSQYVSTIPF